MRISPRQFEGLDKYKYSSVDKSILSRRVLTPWWNWLITLFPYTLAPNAVSVSAAAWRRWSPALPPAHRTPTPNLCGLHSHRSARRTGSKGHA